MNTYLGFDIGGTAIKYGVVRSDGEILFQDKTPTPKSKTNIEIPKIIRNIFYKLNKEHVFNGIGIATAGNLNLKENKVIYAAAIKDYSGTDFNEALKDLNVPIQIENDVNAQALAESWVGAGKDLDNFIMMSIGTGIGGAIIINKKLYRGVNDAAGEFGHMSFERHGLKCACGRIGCVQSYASTPMLSRTYFERTGKNTRGHAFFEKVKKGDPVALDIYNEFVFNISTLIASTVIALDPGYVVLGGGVSEQNILIESLNEATKEKLLDVYKSTKIIPASMGNKAGIVGAAFVIKEKVE